MQKAARRVEKGLADKPPSSIWRAEKGGKLQTGTCGTGGFLPQPLKMVLNR